MSIDSTYFTGEITIPNLDKAANLATLNADIITYEKEILIDALGYQLYSDYITNIALESPAQKWLDLRDGAEFSFDFCGKTVTRKWIGLENSEKKSLIAYFTYAMSLRNKSQTLTGVGVVVGLAENSQVIDSSRKLVNAWNRFIEQYGEVPEGFNGYYDSHYIHFDDKPTIYNFLVANSADYDDWIYTRREDISVL